MGAKEMVVLVQEEIVIKFMSHWADRREGSSGLLGVQGEKF